MKLTLINKALKFTVLGKALTYKKGALLFMSAPVTFGFTEMLNILLKNMEPINVLIPILAISICTIVFSLCFLVDFAFGIVASKHESKGEKGWFKSDMAYNSIGKFLGFLLVNFIISILVLALMVVGLKTFSNGVLIILVLINLVMCLFEIHSIGENIERRTEKKPKMFHFFDKVSDLIEVKVIDKISNLI